MILNKSKYLFKTTFLKSTRLFPTLLKSFSTTSTSTSSSSSSSSFDSLTKNYLNHLIFDENKVNLNESYNGLQVISISSVRSLEFNQPHKGNYLNEINLNTLQTRLDHLKGNWAANAIFIGSNSLYILSNGIHEDDIQLNGINLFKQVQNIAETIQDFPEKNLLAMYDGYTTGTPFGMLLGSTYRLGTLISTLSVDEPLKGQIPLGGFCYKFCHLSPQHGKILARYLALSGAVIEGSSLYDYGILTHLTGHKPYQLFNLHESVPVNDIIAVQAPLGDPEYLPDFVEGIDIHSDMTDLSLHPAWNKILPVPLPRINFEPELGDAHISKIYSDVEYCFSAPTVQETIDRLQTINHPFAKLALENIISSDPFAVRAIYALTDYATAVRLDIEALRDCNENPEILKSLEKKGFYESLKREIIVSEQLIERHENAKATGKGWFPTNIQKKSEFNLADYEKEFGFTPGIEDAPELSLKAIYEKEVNDRLNDEQKKKEFEEKLAQFRTELNNLSEDFFDEIQLGKNFK